LDLSELLTFTVKSKASDLHLSSGLPPLIRIDGDIKRINVDPFSAEDVHSMLYDLMNDLQRKKFEEFLETDFSVSIPNVARFRVNAFNQLRGPSAVFRAIPNVIQTLEDLNAPSIFNTLAMKPKGLILVTGPTGSGKSTTQAAMVNLINESKRAHILTIEDPIEFVHASKNCVINQRELDEHTRSFEAALRSALREDPDIILVGEMRDLETIRLALTAAETGHLVLATLHTTSAAKSVDRIIDVFPGNEKDMIRSMLSESLEAVIAQTLLPKPGGGRIAAWEIMLGTPAIRNLIRENKIPQMYSVMQTSHSQGMQTMDQCLLDLVRRRMITIDIVRERALDKTKIESMMKI
jgi:twitching motility protein PilT